MLTFLIKTLLGLYIALVVIRFLLQWVRADFYNPVSQFVVKLTSPVLRPLRKVIPGYAGLDLSALLLAWLLKARELAILTLLMGLDRNPLAALAWALPALVSLVISIFLWVRPLSNGLTSQSSGTSPLAKGVVGGDEVVGEDLRERPRVLLVLAEVGRRDLFD
jgi:uncharacterized protein YggT (Ycf19 family)